MSHSATKKIVLVCMLAALGVAAAFWALARAAIGERTDDAASPDALPLDFAAPDVASVVYEANGEAAERYECEDSELIANVVKALESVRLGERTDVASSDSGARLTFRLRDGSERSYAFEGGNYLDGDARVTLREGSRELAEALRALANGSKESR